VLAIENGHACNQRYFRLGLIATEAASVLALGAVRPIGRRTPFWMVGNHSFIRN